MPDGPTWADILGRWRLVQQDLQDAGIDLGDPAVMLGRPWPWLKIRVEGLLSADTRLARSFHPPPAHTM